MKSPRDSMSLDAEFSEHAPFLRNLARRLAMAGDTAEDLVHDTYVAARAGEPGGQNGLLPWLVGVLRNRAKRGVRSALRRRAREQAVGAMAEGPATVRVVDKLELGRRLLQQVEALGEQGREVVFLRFYEGLMPQQIAVRLGLPVATVKTRLARALSRLRERLDAGGGSGTGQGRESWLPAMCALGGLDHGLDQNPAAQPLAAGTRRAFGGVQAAGLAVAVIVVALAVRLWPAAAPLQPATDSGAVAQPHDGSSAADTPGDRNGRQPVTIDPTVNAPRARGRIITGLVEDAGIGVPSGSGVPAADVVVRSRLRLRGRPSERARGDGPSALRVSSNKEISIETVTDATGRFRIEVPDGAELLRVTAVGDGLVADAIWSVWTRSRIAEPLLLSRYLRSAFCGRVIEPSGAAVAGAKVRLMHWHKAQRVGKECYTDAHGRFQFAVVPDDPWLQVECDGYVQVRASRPTQGTRGGWQPARIVMAKAATLEFVVESATGRPADCIPGIGVMLAKAESGLVAIVPDASFPFRSHAKMIGGRATLRVPAGLQLALFAGDRALLRQQNGRILGPDATQGAPIAVAAGERTRLKFVVATNVALQVAVLGPDGEPAPAGVDLSFSMVQAGRLAAIRAAETDASGTFMLPLATAERSVCVVVRASGVGATKGMAAVRLLQLEGEQPRSVELRLAPPQGLRGIVRDREGQPVAASIRRVLTIPGVAGPVTESGSWSTGADGAFRVPGIPGAEHRLEFSCDAFATEVRSGLQLGGETIEVVLHRPWPTQLELRVDDPTVQFLGVRIEYLEMAPAQMASLPSLSGTGRRGWLRAARPRQAQHSIVRTVHHHERVVDGSVRLLLEQGPAALAIRGSGARGEGRTRCLSGPVRIPAGPVAVTMDLPKPVACRGRILFSATTPRFDACVALADDHGHLLSIDLPGAPGWHAMLSATTDGHFAIGAVPPGSWELRVGTRAELLRGEARWRQREVFVAERDEPRIVRL